MKLIIYVNVLDLEKLDKWQRNPDLDTVPLIRFDIYQNGSGVAVIIDELWKYEALLLHKQQIHSHGR